MVATVRGVHQVMLSMGDLTQGLGWWLFALVSWGVWGWLGVALGWISLVRYLLPEGGIWAPVAAVVYGAAFLALTFHVALLEPILVLGFGSLGGSLGLTRGWQRWVGVGLVVGVVVLGWYNHPL